MSPDAFVDTVTLRAYTRGVLKSVHRAPAGVGARRHIGGDAGYRLTRE